MSEYDVNTAVKDDNKTPEMKKVKDLMEMFTDVGRYDYGQFPKTSARKHQFREEVEGVMELSESLQRFVNEEREEQETLVFRLRK